MTPEMLWIGAAAAVGALFAGLLLHLLPARDRSGAQLQALQAALERQERALREDGAQTRRDQAEAAAQLRRELGERLQQFLEEARAGRREQTDTLAKFGEAQAQQAQALQRRRESENAAAGEHREARTDAPHRRREAA
jgi:DNA recombination protein RmuC